jgi:hypothetical protein
MGEISTPSALRLPHRQIRRLSALENLAGVIADLADAVTK